MCSTFWLSVKTLDDWMNSYFLLNIYAIEEEKIWTVALKHCVFAMVTKNTIYFHNVMKDVDNVKIVRQCSHAKQKFCVKAQCYK